MKDKGQEEKGREKKRECNKERGSGREREIGEEKERKGKWEMKEEDKRGKGQRKREREEWTCFSGFNKMFNVVIYQKTDSSPFFTPGLTTGD